MNLSNICHRVRQQAGQWSWLRGSRPALLLTGFLLITWWWVILGPNALVLVAGLTVAAAGVWTVRRRRAFAASILVAAITTAVPGALAIWIVSNAPADAPTVAAVLTGHLLAGPVPTLLAWTRCCPAAHRLTDTIIGSALLLASVIPVACFGDHGFGTAALLAGLVSVAAWNWRRQRTARTHPQGNMPTDHDRGWTDLGPRVLPSGEIADKVLVSRSLALLAARRRPTPAGLRHAVDQSEQLAADLHLPPGSLHPVLIDPGADASPRWHHVDTPSASCDVAVVDSDDLRTLAESLGPPPRGRTRALRTQLMSLPVPTAQGAHR